MEYKPIYDYITFDYLMERMLERIPADQDKREGSIIWDALAPAALELINIYKEIDYINKNLFGDTADREWLIKIAKERAIEVEPATAAELKGEFDIELQIGARFNYEFLNYTVTEFIETGGGFFYYKLTSEESGTHGNKYSGDLTPIDNIKNLKIARIVGVITPGEDEESTESLRERYFQSLNREDYGGNIDDYERKVLSIPGIGGVKVFPVWNGGGTVKLIIQDTEWNPPSAEMVSEVQQIIDPIPFQQQGKGIAPIGHFVTVEGVEGKEINITFSIDGPNFEEIKTQAETKIQNYLLELRSQWQKKENLIIRVSQIETRILEIENIIDITGTKINGAEENLILEKNQIPVLGGINNV